MPFRNLTWDEPHIFYHYAKNFASGYGLVFNQDERILGFTSPLYQLILAAGALVTSDLPYLGNLLSVLSLAGFSIVVFLALRQIGLDFWGFVTAIGLIIWPVPYNYMGMETLLLMFLVFSSFYFFICERYLLSAVLISLAILARFDSVVPAGVMLIMYSAEKRRFPWGLAGIGAAILLPWFLFSRIYYGAFLPQTFFAKKAMLSLPQFLSVNLWRFSFRANVIESQALLPLAWFVLPLAGMVFGVLRHRYFRLVLLYALGIAVGYSITGRMEEAWPVFPVTAGMRIFLFCGIYGVAALCGRLLKTGVWSRLVRTAVLVVLVAPVLIHDFSRLEAMPESPYFRYHFVSRMKTYEEVGEWLRENGGPSATVFTPEPGALAYYGGCIFFDYYGLMTRKGWKVPLDEVGRDLRPDYIVMSDDYLAELGPDVPGGYEVVRVFNNPPYQPVLIIARNDLARQKK